MTDTPLTGPGWTCVWPLATTLGEGPIWHDGALWFTDIEGRALHRYTPATGARDSWSMPCRVGSIAPRRGGGFVAGTEHGFALVDPPAGSFELLDHPEAHLPGNRFNDGKVHPDGQFWAGTMDDEKQHARGSLYRLAPDHGWSRHDEGYRITNGPAFSPDGATLYHTDTLARETYAFDVSLEGELLDKRVLAAWPEGWGNPDGMTTDAEGCLWIAFWGGWCVRRVSPAGELVSEHKLPASNITSCAFGGPGLDRLYVTSARQALDAEALAAQPLAGGLFEIDPGVRGLPGGVFAG